MQKEKIVFFGAGSIAEKTLRAGYNRPIYIFDNNKDLLNTKQDGIDILSPEQIKDKINDFEKIIITTSSFTDVINQLNLMGINKSKYEVSSILDSLKFVDLLENHHAKYLFTSGLPSFSKDESGGGFYLLDIKGKNYELKKIHSGNCHGVIFDRENNEYLITDNDLGVVIFDGNLNKKRVLQTKKGLRPHGISLIEDDFLAMGCTFDDSVHILKKKDGSFVSRLGLSDKINLNRSPQHHLNDVWCSDKKIYASMFSVSGEWKNGNFDGTVVCFNGDYFDSQSGN